MKPGSSVRSRGRLSSWLIVAAGFIAYPGLVFALNLAEIKLEMPLPGWAAQALSFLLCAALVLLIARARSVTSLIGGTLLLWIAQLLVGVLTEAFAAALSASGTPGATGMFPPPPLPALLGVVLLLAPLRDLLRAETGGRNVRQAPAERRPVTARRAPAAMAPAAADRALVARPPTAPLVQPAEGKSAASVEPRHVAGVAAAPAPPSIVDASELATSIAEPAEKPPRGTDSREAQPRLDELLARDTTDEPLRISFARVAAQLPAEMFSSPMDQVGAELDAPGCLLIPRRIALAQLAEGAVRARWNVVAGQFPRRLIMMSDEEVTARLPEGQLVLPLDEIVRQLPAALFMPPGPEPDLRSIDAFPEPFQPLPAHRDLAQQGPPAGAPTDAMAAAGETGVLVEREPHTVSAFPASAPHPAAEPPVAAMPPAQGEARAEPRELGLPPEIRDPSAAGPRAGAEAPEESAETGPWLLREPPVDSETAAETACRPPVGRPVEEAVPEPASLGGGDPIPPEEALLSLGALTPDASAARVDIGEVPGLVEGLAPPGAFEVRTRTVNGVRLLSLTSAGLDGDMAAAAAASIFPLLDGRTPWPVDQVTLRGERVAVVLTPLGPLEAGGTVLVAAVPAGGSLALLEIRCRQAAGRHGARMGPEEAAGGDPCEERDEPDLLDVEPSTWVHEMASRLSALGTVTASSLRDAEADRAFYLFLPPGSDVRAVGALANDLSRVMRQAGASGFVFRVAVLRSGARRLVIRLPARGSGRSDTIVAAGETARPGLAYRQVENAASALGAL